MRGAGSWTNPLIGLAIFAVAAVTMPSTASPISPQSLANVTLAIGDPVTQKALELSGEINRLPFKVLWANISGGPQTIEAFRAHALDLGAVADIPAIHATWTGLPVKIVAVEFRQDPIHHAVYGLGIAPGANINKLADLRGKKIAYSPGQAQGALVLRILQKAGLRRRDVTLVELPSTGDVYPNAIASHLVDAAPIGRAAALRYLRNYGRDGAKVIEHGLRDDPLFLYAPVSVLQDPAKAAAIRAYIEAWARATRWVHSHPDAWIAGYYVKQQGLSPEDGHNLVVDAGNADLPISWNDAIARQQQTIDLLAKETGKPRFNAADLFDRRFETVAAHAIATK
jgi:sulfonate transport system substrate-binding protein